MSTKVDILGIKVATAGVDGAADMIENMIEQGGFHSVFTPNSEIILNAYKNPDFANVINSADLLTADGIGVVYASKILGRPINERAAGYDISRKLMAKMAAKGYSLYLFGAAPGVAQTAAEKLKMEYPDLKIAGFHDGYFDAAEEKNIINDINGSGADVVFVCLGSPKQEKWIAANAANLNVKVAMGLGGCIDVYAGNVKRAPDVFIKFGLEWFYRLMKEPKRFWRMLSLPKFLLTVIKIRIFGGKKHES